VRRGHRNLAQGIGISAEGEGGERGGEVAVERGEEA
jgi:hypothetical protein